jgi:hypothetical protein
MLETVAATVGSVAVVAWIAPDCRAAAACGEYL